MKNMKIVRKYVNHMKRHENHYNNKAEKNMKIMRTYKNHMKRNENHNRNSYEKHENHENI